MLGVDHIFLAAIDNRMIYSSSQMIRFFAIAQFCLSPSNHNCASAKIICNAPGFTAVPYAAARVETSSRIENNSSS